MRLHKKLEGTAAEKQQEVIKFLQAVENLKKCSDELQAISLIRDHKLVREHVPSALLNSKEVWNVLLERMPMTAMLRNLAKMTTIGVLESGNENSKKVVAALSDQAALEKARIHPFNVLLGWYTYKSGHGDRGKLQWIPVPEIIAALENAFYATFKNVPTTGKRYLVALDVSGSMTSPIMNSSLSCRDASAAMSLLHLRNEPQVDVVAFQHQLTELHLKKEYTMDQVINTISDLEFGNTDCSLPMLWAKKMKRSYDVFIVYTDNDTWCGLVHPAHALRLYRQKMALPDAKLIVVGMTATEFTIADPKDRGMLDVAGFDSAAPEVMRNFVLGLI